ncbi:unnamed protein product [Pleuronectes platessa]|uniref:Uncharacterized protein n=1 Tax=Pleuronectes platessa TaxID=8262 RepID=A0A9N7UQU1_PLEPL|nr:unnamed protein product [Pleuronectes platessa]
MRRRGDEETRRRGDEETRRQGDKETGRVQQRWLRAVWHGKLVFHHMQGPERVGPDVEVCVGCRGGGEYHAAGGSRARFGGNENGLSGRLMAHKDRAFRWDGRLNLLGSD